MITKLNLYKESILVPRNIEGRQDKLRQETIKLLSQEIIEGNFILEKYMLDIPQNLIKVKTINGYLDCSFLNIEVLPEWFKDLTVNGNFDCSSNELITLENSPQNIEGYFFCNDNKLISLKGCPEIITGDFYCQDNQLTSLEYGPKKVLGYYICYDNMDKLEKPLPNDCDIWNEFIN